MKLVFTVILVALIGGLLWALWFVLTNPRRRAHQIAAELSAPGIGTSEALVVGYRRWATGGAALCFALLLVNVVTRTHAAMAMVVLLGLLVPVVAGFGWLTLSGKPVLEITNEGIVTRRPERRLRWEEIDTIAIAEGKGFAGVETYDLILHVAPKGTDALGRRITGRVAIVSETICIPLALLSPSWHDIVLAIRERSGLQPIIPSRYTAIEPHEVHVKPR